MTTSVDIDLYVNFVLHAILGLLGEADQIVRIYGHRIRRVAAELAARRPPRPAPLYRGMLLDPDLPFAAAPDLTFLSWSEDPRVARWFASPRSIISEPLARGNPRLVDHVAEIPASSARVLFHHAWAPVFGDLAGPAKLHPRMREEGSRQIAWSLRTQREVITEPAANLQPRRVPDLDARALKELERDFAPPWILGEGTSGA